jgi:hypothetical protein
MSPISRGIVAVCGGSVFGEWKGAELFRDGIAVPMDLGNNFLWAKVDPHKCLVGSWRDLRTDQQSRALHWQHCSIGRPLGPWAIRGKSRDKKP